MMPTPAELYVEIQHLHAHVARLLDNGQFDQWPGCFTEDGEYKVQSRENFDRGWPLALIALEGRAMLQDRIVGATDTIFHDPYSQRHLMGPPLIVHDGGDVVHCEAPYLVMRTHRDRLPEVLSVGRYIDELLRDGTRWLIRRRWCIYDNDLVPNSLIYPI